MIGIAAGIVVGLTSDRVADNLRQRAVQIAKNRYGLELQIDALELNFFPLGVELDHVRIERPDVDGTWIKAESASVEVRPWPSAAGAIVIERMTVNGFAIDLRQIGERGANTSRPSALKIDVRELSFTNSRVISTLPGGELDLRNVDLTMKPMPRGGRSLELQVGRSTLQLDGKSVDLEAEIDATLSGSIDRPQTLALTTASIKTPELMLSAGGQVDFRPEVPELELRLGAEMELARVSDFTDALPPLSGHAIPSVRVSGTVSEPEVRLELEATDVGIAQSKLGDVAIDAVYAGDRILIEALEVEHPRAGRLTGSGSVGLKDGFPLRLRSRMHTVVLEEILRESGVAGAWVRLRLDGDARVDGTLSPLSLRTKLDGKIGRFEALASSYYKPDARQILVLNQVPISGRAEVSKRAVNLENVSLGPDDARFDVKGAILYREGLRLDARSERCDMEWLGPIADVEFTGEGPVEARIEGRFSKLTIEGDTTMRGFGLLGRSLGDTSAAVSYRASTLRFNDVLVKRGAGSVRGAGQLVFGGPPRIEAAADLRRIDVADSLVDLKLSPSLARRIDAAGDGRLILHGLLAKPGGIIHARAPRAAIDGVELGAMNLEVGFGPGERKLWGEIGLARQSGLVDVQAAWLEDDSVTLAGQLANVPLLSMRRFFGGALVDGSLSGRFNLKGPLDAMEGSAGAQLQRLSVNGVRFETTRFRAQVEDGVASVKGSLLSGAALAEGKIRLDGDFPFTVSSSFEELDAERAVDLGDAFSSQLTGSIFAQGPLLKPSRVMADFKIEKWTITLADETLTVLRPVNLQWAERTLLIPDAAFRGPDVQILLSGRIPLDGGMKLKLSGNGTLGSLAHISPRVTRGAGSTAFQIGIRGTFADPQLSGQVTVADGEVALSGGSEAATGINARVNLSGATANIEYASMRIGNGDVRLGGQLVFAAENESELNVRADFDRMSFEPSAGVTTTISGNLSLLGRLNDLRLRGDVEIDRLRYERKVSLADLIPRRRSSRLKVPAIESSEVIDISVKVHAKDNIFVKNNVIDAELKADLTVTGNTNRVGLLGTISPLRAEARYAGNLYTLSRGTIDFTEEYEVFSRFNIQAKTEACGMDVSVDVFGDSESYTVSPSGSDENGTVEPQDVLICLQFGSRSRDFNANGAPVTTSAVGGASSELAAAASGIDALWTVSGLDDRVRDVIPIDEVRITNAWSPQANAIRPRLVLGKEIGEAIRVQYWQSLVDQTPEEAYQAINVQYQLSRRATLEGTWLSEYQASLPVTDLGLDIRLRWELR